MFMCGNCIFQASNFNDIEDWPTLGTVNVEVCIDYFLLHNDFMLCLCLLCFSPGCLRGINILNKFNLCHYVCF